MSFKPEHITTPSLKNTSATVYNTQCIIFLNVSMSWKAHIPTYPHFQF